MRIFIYLASKYNSFAQGGLALPDPRRAKRSRGKEPEDIDNKKVKQGLETQVQQVPRDSTILQVEKNEIHILFASYKVNKYLVHLLIKL